MLLRFLNALDTPGGHIAICLGLLIGYAHYQGGGLQHDIAIFALGVLSRSMGTKKDNLTYASTPVATHVETQTTTDYHPDVTVHSEGDGQEQ